MTYRYHLARQFLTGSGLVNFVMLNPSTATDDQDDPTVRRCIGFARSWGYQRLSVTNLFAWRATRPADLRTVADPVGPGNDAALLEAAGAADLVLAAWGVHGALLGRGVEVQALLRAVRPLYALGLTARRGRRFTRYMLRPGRGPGRLTTVQRGTILPHHDSKQCPRYQATHMPAVRLALVSARPGPALTLSAVPPGNVGQAEAPGRHRPHGRLRPRADRPGSSPAPKGRDQWEQEKKLSVS